MGIKLNDIIPTDSPVTCTMMTVIVLVGVLGIIRRDLFLRMVLHPFSIVYQSQYYRIFLADLLSNDLMHLLLNEFVLCFFGGNLEEELNRRSAHGSIDFMLIYGCSLLCGALYATIRHRNDFDFSSAGASGSVLGCAFSYMVLKPNAIACYLPVIGGLENKYEALILIVVLVIYQKKTNNEMINHDTHLFGAVGGVVATLVLFPQIIKL